MLPITDYTDTNAVRGAVGVTDNEITDAMLTDQGMDLELTADLAVWLPDHATLFDTGEGVGATAAQQLVSTYIKLYAQWFCAYLLVGAMRLGVMQSQSDGKAEYRRFTGFDFEILTLNIMARRDLYKSRLSESQGDTAAVSSLAVMARAVPDYDPVSNT